MVIDKWEEHEVGCYKLVPTDATPVPLAAEITALERELESRGHTSVLNHLYKWPSPRRLFSHALGVDAVAEGRAI